MYIPFAHLFVYFIMWTRYILHFRFTVQFIGFSESMHELQPFEIMIPIGATEFFFTR